MYLHYINSTITKDSCGNTTLPQTKSLGRSSCSRVPRPPRCCRISLTCAPYASVEYIIILHLRSSFKWILPLFFLLPTPTLYASLFHTVCIFNTIDNADMSITTYCHNTHETVLSSSLFCLLCLKQLTFQ